MGRLRYLLKLRIAFLRGMDEQTMTNRLQQVLPNNALSLLGYQFYERIHVMACAMVTFQVVDALPV